MNAFRIALANMRLAATPEEKFKAKSEKNRPTGITRGLATFIDIAELAGAIGIVSPHGSQHCPIGRRWACDCHAAGDCVPRAPPRVARRMVAPCRGFFVGHPNAACTSTAIASVMRNQAPMVLVPDSSRAVASGWN